MVPQYLSSHNAFVFYWLKNETGIAQYALFEVFTPISNSVTHCVVLFILRTGFNHCNLGQMEVWNPKEKINWLKNETAITQYACILFKNLHCKIQFVFDRNEAIYNITFTIDKLLSLIFFLDNVCCNILTYPTGIFSTRFYPSAHLSVKNFYFFAL